MKEKKLITVAIDSPAAAGAGTHGPEPPAPVHVLRQSQNRPARRNARRSGPLRALAPLG